MEQGIFPSQQGTDRVEQGIAPAVASKGFPQLIWLLLIFIFRRARQIDGAPGLAGGAIEQSERARQTECWITVGGY